ncbi:hypothetical protein AA0117_g13074 [Alternaria alternata]|uniref:ribonuclease H n=1 Tax=Alternaria alternata TaxID=5599 RepID=A0A4Q4MX42_ALTAL|nr:hypothetical protein AA0117_g13074 [Alternaria alternata]
MGDRENIIHNRKFTLCDATTDWPISELLKECPKCNNFLLYCCSCNNKSLDLPRNRRSTEPCHHFRIIFTDGACTDNGRPAAKAGVGVAYGSDEGNQLSAPITDTVDDFPLRSNQRAELCAAKLGIELLAKAHTEELESEAEAWIIATDSQYVVQGMTEWLPKWRRNDWHTSKGTKPTNLDLFLTLDTVVRAHEANGITIGFWHIPREHNKIADGLAKVAAVCGDQARV